MRSIDVSVVLNMHREAPYLRATLRSLDACALKARDEGLRCELVAVFDHADFQTRQVFESTPMTGFDSHVAVDVGVGSLGLARNAGVDASSGEFIWTADADDLVSQNAIVQLHKSASSGDRGGCAVFMSYLVAFGGKYLVGKYHDSSLLTIADFVWHHPYISRIFLSRTVFQKHRFRDLKLTSGFAYEDWDFLVRLRQDGFHFEVAPDTVFFYRQRADSLLRQADAMSAQMIPHSPFFEPEWFLRELERERQAIRDWPAFVEKRRQTNLVNYATELIEQPPLLEAVMDANRLDPEVDPVKIASSPSYSPVPWHDDHIGFRLAEGYRMVGQWKYDEVALLPSLNPGKLQSLILRTLHAVAAGAPEARLLVLCCEPTPRHEWMDHLPDQAILLDAYNAFPSLSDTDRDRLIARLLLAVGSPRSRLHIGSSESVDRLMEEYGSIVLEHFSVFFHRTDPDLIDWSGRQIECPAPMSLLRKHVARFAGIVYSSEQTAQTDQQRIGPQVKNWVVSPAPSYDMPATRHAEVQTRLREMLLLAHGAYAAEDKP